MQDFINKYTGVSVGDGQCGSLVRAYWTEVDKTDPPSYPSAVDYWLNPAPPYSHTSNPQVGDTAVYNAHPGFPDGHIAIVTELTNPVTVFEQNADPDGSPAHLFQRSTQYLLGYLTQGEDMSYWGELEFHDGYEAMFGPMSINEPTAYDRQRWVYDGTNGATAESNTALRAMQADARHTAWLSYIQDLQDNQNGTPTVVVNGKPYVPES